MKPQNLQSMSTDELQKKVTTLRRLTLIFAICWLLLTAITIYIILTDGFTPLIATSTALLPIFIVNMNNKKKLETELISRQQNPY